MKKLIIVGAGGLGRELLQWVKDINTIKKSYHILGFLSDFENDLNKLECSHSIIGSIQDWIPKPDEYYTCAIANPIDKEQITSLLTKKGAQFTNIIHPTAVIGSHNNIGKGFIMYPNARITVNCKIGDFITLQSCTIGHDAFINDYSTISSNVLITGNVKIGKRVFIASSTTITPKLKVEDDSYIGAGSIVLKDVKEKTTVYGNPARNFIPIK